MSESLINLVEKSVRDVRWLYLGAMIVLFVFINVQIPTTARPTEMTIDFYNIVVAAKPGDVCIVQGTLMAWQSQVYLMNRQNSIKYWVDHGVVVVWVCGAATQSWDILWAKDVFGVPWDQDLQSHPDYGKKFIIVPSTWDSPYVTSLNFRGSGDRDIFGTSFDLLPGVAKVTIKNVYAVIASSLGGDYTVAYGRVGIKCLATGCSGALCVAATYYGVGLIKGVLVGVKGGMEFDQMLGLKDTLAFKVGPAFSALSAYVFATVIVINVVNYYSVVRRKRPLAMRYEE